MAPAFIFPAGARWERKIQWLQSKILMKDGETEARPQRFALLLLLAETSHLAQRRVE